LLDGLFDEGRPGARVGVGLRREGLLLRGVVVGVLGIGERRLLEVECAVVELKRVELLVESRSGRELVQPLREGVADLPERWYRLLYRLHGVADVQD
jgi:hypothetical protein